MTVWLKRDSVRHIQLKQPRIGSDSVNKGAVSIAEVFSDLAKELQVDGMDRRVTELHCVKM